MQKIYWLKEKKLIRALENQTHLYDELVVVIDKALDNYFDCLDDLMVSSDKTILESLSSELLVMRNDLADVFDLVLRLRDSSDFQVKRLKNPSNSSNKFS